MQDGVAVADVFDFLGGLRPGSAGSVEYRDVPGWPGYRVGDDGSAWCCKKRGNGYGRFGSWRRMKCSPGTDGYQRLVLSDGKRRRYARLNHLVIEVFVGPAPEGMECAHDNGIRGDNRLTNLRWDTHLNNMLDKVRHGTSQIGERNGASKLTAAKIKEIRRRRAGGEKLSSIAADFGIQPSSVGNIAARRRWKHLLEETPCG